MPHVTFIEYDGTDHRVEVPEGWTLMQAALRAGIDGIEGECGGSCACATCHIYVADSDLERLPPPSLAEDKILALVMAERRSTSRLGCQIRMTPALDGLTIHLPETQ